MTRVPVDKVKSLVDRGRLVAVKARTVAEFLSYRLGASPIEALFAVKEPEMNPKRFRSGAYTIGWGFVWWRSQWYRLLDLTTWFKPGDGITLRWVSDCYPATVERVTRTRVVARRDKATRLDDLGRIRGGPFTEAQEYAYEPDPDGDEIVGTLRKTGVVKALGASTRSEGATISYGRRYYRDPSF